LTRPIVASSGKLQVLTAPFDGVVQQLAVHTVGGIVTPAQALAVVVPADSHLEIQAMVSNREIGFVHAGQEAEIEIDTFSLGTGSCKVRWLTCRRTLSHEINRKISPTTKP
jgi:multidrug resistance efflux pump